MNPFRNLYVVLFARPSFKRFNTILFHLGLRGLGVLNFQNDGISGERFLVQTWLPRSIRRPRPTLFDVGANVGDYTKLLSDKFPDASIHAFEPHPSTFKRLAARNFPAQTVVCNNKALGEQEGVLRLFDYADYAGSQHASFHEATFTTFHNRAATSSEVTVSTLDDYAALNGVEYVDFLKIDTEGHELAVLRGAGKLLRERRIGPIQFEFNSLNVFSRVFFSDFRDLLKDYKLYRLLPNGLLELGTDVTSTELFAFQNILAVPLSATT